MTLMSKLLMAAALALPVAGFASTAAASEDSDAPAWVHPIRWDDNFNDRALPRHVIRAQLETTYTNVHDLDRSGDFYVARAEDGDGRDVRLTADAYTGRITQVRTVSDNDRYRTYYNDHTWSGGHRDSWHNNDNWHDSKNGF